MVLRGVVHARHIFLGRRGADRRTGSRRCDRRGWLRKRQDRHLWCRRSLFFNGWSGGYWWTWRHGGKGRGWLRKRQDRHLWYRQSLFFNGWSGGHRWTWSHGRNGRGWLRRRQDRRRWCRRSLFFNGWSGGYRWTWSHGCNRGRLRRWRLGRSDSEVNECTDD